MAAIKCYRLVSLHPNDTFVTYSQMTKNMFCKTNNLNKLKYTETSAAAYGSTPIYLEPECSRTICDATLLQQLFQIFFRRIHLQNLNTSCVVRKWTVHYKKLPWAWYNSTKIWCYPKTGTALWKWFTTAGRCPNKTSDTWTQRARPDVRLWKSLDLGSSSAT